MIDPYSWVTYEGKHCPAYANDYIRIYIHDDWRDKAPPGSPGNAIPLLGEHARILHLQDVGDRNMDFGG